MPAPSAPSAQPAAEGSASAAPAASAPEPVPNASLPTDAPKRVRLGVIQFAYRGAEQAPASAPSREVARERARAAIEVAAQDFAAAVALGDRGSGADLGSFPRGVLEPELEYVAFTLAAGTVHPEPVDTPRGYWVLKRLR